MQKLLLFAWLPLVIFLFPLPPQAAKQLMNEIQTKTGEKSDVTGVPKENKKQQAFSKTEFDVLVTALWDRWLQNLGWLALGLFVGVMAWRGRPYWQLFPLGMSIFYLAVVIYSYVRMERAVPDSLLFFGTENHFVRIVQFHLRLVEVGVSNGSLVRPAWVIYKEFLMPIFQVVVLGWLLWMYSRRNPVGGSDQTIYTYDA